jgi:methanogenic corrinoid protein MtbC1
MYIVGELWEQGNISVAEEHQATEIVVRVLALQREARRVAAGRQGHRVVLAAPSGEHHVVALRMVHNLLRDAGYDVVMLGPDVPIDALAEFARRGRPGAVCLSATMPVAFDDIDLLVRTVHDTRPSSGFVVGGRGFGGRLPSHLGLEFCDRVTEVVDTVDAIVQRARLN